MYGTPPGIPGLVLYLAVIKGVDKGILSGLIVVTRMHMDDFSLSILA